MQIDINKIFKKFLKTKEIYDGKSANEIVKERFEAYESLKKIFDNIDEMRKEDFGKILYFEFNKSWSKLERHKTSILSDIPRLKNSLKLILNELLDIKYRFDQVVNRKVENHINGIGIAVASGILHIYDSKQYGVWNGRSIRALERLVMLPSKQTGYGAYYKVLNDKLHEIKDFLKTDLTTLDLFLGYIYDKPQEYFEEYKVFDDLEEFEEYSSTIIPTKSIDKEKLLRMIKKRKTPKELNYTVKQYYRNPNVTTLALLRASGTCEYCNEPAPFLRTDGSPYLEAHHLIPLSKKGNDDIDNVSAICPNCHKELHFGNRREIKSGELLEKIAEKNSLLYYK